MMDMKAQIKRELDRANIVLDRARKVRSFCVYGHEKVLLKESQQWYCPNCFVNGQTYWTRHVFFALIWILSGLLLGRSLF